MQTWRAPLVLHGLQLGVGSAEGSVSKGRSCLLGLSTGPLIFCSLDKASNEWVCACTFSLGEAAKATTFFANAQAALQLRQ